MDKKAGLGANPVLMRTAYKIIDLRDMFSQRLQRLTRACTHKFAMVKSKRQSSHGDKQTAAHLRNMEVIARADDG